MADDCAPTSNSSTRQPVRRPSRGADRNQDLVNRADPASDDLLLPALADGITLLDIEGDRGVPVLHSLVLDHLLVHDGPAFWVDADGYATTTAMARLAPVQRTLDRIHVARGFTAYQHYAAVCDLPMAANRHARTATTGDTTPSWPGQPRDGAHDGDGSPYTPSLIVCPALDARYRSADALGDAHARTLQARVLARLATYARGYDAPVVVTRTTTDDVTAPIETAADQRLRCERTRMGPRFVGDAFETLLYPVDDGAYHQTTLAYWRRLLGARADQLGLDPAGGPRRTAPSSAVGSGATVDGTTATMTASPLCDAWRGPAGPGGR